MGLLEDLNTGKYNLILFIVLFVLAFHQYFFKLTKEPMVQEHMADVSETQIASAVKKYYLADVEAIRNLSNIATQLQAGGLTCPGSLIVPKDLKVGSWTIKEGDYGHLIFLKDGTKYNPNYYNIPENTGFLAMAGDGNFWSNRSTSRGWLPDNISSLVPNLVPRGTIIAWNGGDAPAGWVVCDGTNGTHDLRGRFILGAGQGNGLSNRQYAQKGGAETHKLNANEIPQHRHITADFNAREGGIRWDDGYKSMYLGNGNNFFSLGGGAAHFGTQKDSDKAFLTGDGNENQSGLIGAAHNNMPPFYVLTYIMKT